MIGLSWSLFEAVVVKAGPVVHASARVAGLSAAVWFGGAGLAQACACCAAEGARWTTEGPIDAVDVDLIEIATWPQRALFDGPFLDGPLTDEATEGPSVAEEVSLEVSRSIGVIQFDLAAADGRSGTLLFTLAPETVVQRFAVDLAPGVAHVDQRTSTGHLPLYVERRYAGAEGRGAGALAWADGLPARFILHGRGNACPFADVATHFTLELQTEFGPFRLIAPL